MTTLILRLEVCTASYINVVYALGALGDMIRTDFTVVDKRHEQSEHECSEIFIAFLKYVATVENILYRIIENVTSYCC